MSGQYEDLDDDTFVAVQELNHPGIVEATRPGGLNTCPCSRCSRLRAILEADAQDPARLDIDPADTTWLDIDPADTTAEGVGNIADFFRGLGFDVQVMDGRAPQSRQPKVDLSDYLGGPAFNEAPDNMRAASIDYAESEANLRQARKDTPVASGVIAYFPQALCAVAQVSKVGNDQHNPGQPLHWAREKSTDETDALVRHLLDYLGGEDHDTDGMFHLAKVAWRALALLERFLDGEEPGR